MIGIGRQSHCAFWNPSSILLPHETYPDDLLLSFRRCCFGCGLWHVYGLLSPTRYWIATNVFHMFDLQLVLHC
eukprot:scaffold234567_cov51-Attheya_sp.AAC.1